MHKKIIFVLCLFVVLATVFTCIPVCAAQFEADVDTVSESILLVNLDKDIVVFEKEADKKMFPASTTKIMTYIVVVEHVSDLENTKVKIKQEVIDLLSGTGSSMSGLEYRIGDEISVLDLLYCLMVSSGNDASLVLADYVGNGSISAFVKMMNDKAKDLGLKNTNFTNPHGLHEANHYTTARELYKMTSYALTLPRFSEISNTVTHYIEGSDYPLVTTNYMIDEGRGGEYYYPYAKGIKTGTTDEAGRCLVSTAFADGYAYMCITLNAPYEENVKIGSMIDSAALYRWAFKNLQLKTIIDDDKPVCEVKLDYAWEKDTLRLTPEKTLSTILPINVESSSFDITYDIPEKIEAPVQRGDVIGTARISYANQELATVSLVADESVERSQLLFATTTVKRVLSSGWFVVAVIIVVVLFIGYIILTVIYNSRMKSRKKVKNYRNL